MWGGYTPAATPSSEARVSDYPAHSFILDLGDDNMKNIFSQEELLEIQDFGSSLLVHPVNNSISSDLTLLGEMDDILEVYNHFRRLDYHPLLDHLVAWLAMSITNTSFNFLGSRPLTASFESDNLYNFWGFLNTTCFYSKIEVISKEKSSIANGKAMNAKRKLSSLEEVSRKAVGRNMDTIYVDGEMEIGALEIGNQKNDGTKDLKDGYLKLPIVMKDMMKTIIDKHPAMKKKVNIVGYNIQGKLYPYNQVYALILTY
ncbi:hypothetical protein G6F42_025183 [Rhizopus arrhizus]|nr:hypothetical protein G6F42_025183 [Rhizopus arrhizus]